MAAKPKPGDKNYKGPVHEAVRGAIKPIVDLFNPPSKAPPVKRPSAHQQVLDNQAAYRKDKLRLSASQAKARVAAATKQRKSDGNYDAYDPLSSITAPAMKPRKRPIPMTTKKPRTKKAKS